MMRYYGESVVIGFILEKWPMIPDYGNLDNLVLGWLSLSCGNTMVLKDCSSIELSCLYTTWGAFIILRPTIMIKVQVQKTDVYCLFALD